MYRELLKLSGEENRMLSEEPMDLIKNVEILKALSEATREAPLPQRVGPGKMRKTKPGPGSQAESSIDSPVPSPGFPGRLKSNSIRSSSVVRDNKDLGARFDDGNDGAKGLNAERAGKFVVNAEVAYKQTKPKEDGGQWIQCIILSVTEVAGNKKRFVDSSEFTYCLFVGRYEVRDPEPDENGTQGDVYRTSAAALIAIPPPGTPLPDYPVGKVVLARYPETTTFYRAEVMGLKKDTYRLKFDDDAGNENEVDRRYVLDLGNR